MEHRARFSTRTEEGDCGETVADFLLERGWQEEVSGERRMVFIRPFHFSSWFGWRVEELPARLDLRWAEREGGAGDETLVTLDFQIVSRFRLWSHLDQLWFDLEIEALHHFLETGIRVETIPALDRVRRPVATAVIVNVVASAALVTAAGVVIDFGLGATMLIAAAVALINYVTILGFADLVVDGMLELERFRQDDRPQALNAERRALSRARSRSPAGDRACPRWLCARIRSPADAAAPRRGRVGRASR